VPQEGPCQGPATPVGWPSSFRRAIRAIRDRTCVRVSVGTLAHAGFRSFGVTAVRWSRPQRRPGHA
jgi:hypothetical protein